MNFLQASEFQALYKVIICLLSQRFSLRHGCCFWQVASSHKTNGTSQSSRPTDGFQLLRKHYQSPNHLQLLPPTNCSSTFFPKNLISKQMEPPLFCVGCFTCLPSVISKQMEHLDSPAVFLIGCSKEMQHKSLPNRVSDCKTKIATLMPG